MAAASSLLFCRPCLIASSLVFLLWHFRRVWKIHSRPRGRDLLHFWQQLPQDVRERDDANGMLLMIQNVNTVQFVDTQDFEDLRKLGVGEHDVQRHRPQSAGPVWIVTLYMQSPS
jgi:hypothetical protein